MTNSNIPGLHPKGDCETCDGIREAVSQAQEAFGAKFRVMGMEDFFNLGKEKVQDADTAAQDRHAVALMEWKEEDKLRQRATYYGIKLGYWLARRSLRECTKQYNKLNEKQAQLRPYGDAIAGRVKAYELMLQDMKIFYTEQKAGKKDA